MKHFKHKDVEMHSIYAIGILQKDIGLCRLHVSVLVTGNENRWSLITKKND